MEAVRIQLGMAHGPYLSGCPDACWLIRGPLSTSSLETSCLPRCFEGSWKLFYLVVSSSTRAIYLPQKDTYVHNLLGGLAAGVCLGHGLFGNGARQSLVDPVTLDPGEARRPHTLETTTASQIRKHVPLVDMVDVGSICPKVCSYFCLQFGGNAFPCERVTRLFGSNPS